MIYYLNFSKNHFFYVFFERLLNIENKIKLNKITFKQINILQDNDRVVFLLNDEIDLVYVSEVMEITSNILIFSDNENLIKKLKLIDNLNVFSLNNYNHDFIYVFLKKFLKEIK